MHLYVIRHAVAEAARPGQDDASRDLTDSGERKFRRSVKGLRALGWTFDRVLTSPWTRARRTAELLAPVSEHDPVPTDLLCDSPSRELLAMIGEAGTSSMAVVGHEPWLSELVQWLVLADPHRDALVIRKGGVVWLEGEAVPGAMKMRALVPPKLLRSL
jgi:phosphohistidine phosphatase